MLFFHPSRNFFLSCSFRRGTEHWSPISSYKGNIWYIFKQTIWISKAHTNEHIRAHSVPHTNTRTHTILLNFFCAEPISIQASKARVYHSYLQYLTNYSWFLVAKCKMSVSPSVGPSVSPSVSLYVTANSKKFKGIESNSIWFNKIRSIRNYWPVSLV